MKAMTKSLTSQSSLTPVISAALEAFDVFTVERVAEGVGVCMPHVVRHPDFLLLWTLNSWHNTSLPLADCGVC